MFIISVVKDNNGTTVGANCNIDGKQVFLNIEQLYQCRSSIQNAVVCSNGVVRGKSGSLPVVEPSRKVIRVYHGSRIKEFTPKFGLGEDKHDYGRGFYTTQNIELAKEWAKIRKIPGYLHTYDLDMSGLRIFNFNKVNVLSWVAELMSHRAADDSVRYERLSKKFIEMYKLDTNGYDIIYGWRADSSYFNIVKRFVRDELDANLIKELFMLGDLDNQICVKSMTAFSRLKKVLPVVLVDDSYYDKYNIMDKTARDNMHSLIRSDRNTMQCNFTYCIQERRNI